MVAHDRLAGIVVLVLVVLRRLASAGGLVMLEGRGVRVERVRFVRMRFVLFVLVRFVFGRVVLGGLGVGVGLRMSGR